MERKQSRGVQPLEAFETKNDGKRVMQPKVIGKDVFYNAFPFYMHLHTYDVVDIMCYTFNVHLVTESLSVDRVIATKLTYAAPDVNVRLASNVHTKMYLCYHNKLDSVFVGSWNFSSPSYVEVIAKLPRRENKNALEYFNNIWKQLE